MNTACEVAARRATCPGVARRAKSEAPNRKAFNTEILNARRMLILAEVNDLRQVKSFIVCDHAGNLG